MNIGKAAKLSNLTIKTVRYYANIGLVKPEQECADPKKSSWVKSEVFTVVTDNFKNTAGSAGMEYFKKRTLF